MSSCQAQQEITMILLPENSTTKSYKHFAPAKISACGPAD